MDGPGKLSRYKMLHIACFHLYEMSRKEKLTKTDNRFVTAGNHRSRVRDVYKCVQGLLEGEENILELESDDSCPAWNVLTHTKL